jgi:hypothetical protein
MPTVPNRSLVVSWNLAKGRLTRAKDAEMRFRKLVAERLFDAPKIGTNTAHVTNSADIKLVHKVNYKLSQDNELLSSGYLAVQAIDKDAADRLYKVTYSLREVEYAAMSEEVRKAFEATGVLIISDAAPQLKLVDPNNEFGEA